MLGKTITAEQFPTIYQGGQPVAVLVDLPTFEALLAATERLDQIDAADEPWIAAIVNRIRAYRRQHPDTVQVFDTPEAALAALDT